ncbi:MAG: hypothetical protein QGH63_03875, partial [Rhodospirillales bacterium]|nr:hypothetical protein [Rhodospirillales bacterium]
MNAITNAVQRRCGELGVTGVFVLAFAIVAAVYFVSAPLVMMLASAFRGPDDLLPFERGADWTLDHFTEIYFNPLLYQETIPQTLSFGIGAVTVAFVTAFTLAWLVERTDIPGRNIIFTFILFPLLIPTVILAIAWIFMFGPNAGWVNVAIRSFLNMDGSGPINIFTMS